MINKLEKTNSPPSTGAFLLRLAACVLAVNLFVVSLTGYSLNESRGQHRERAEVTTQNLSQVIEQHIGATITKLDVVLLTTVDEIKKQIASGGIEKQSLDAFMTRHCSSLPELDGLRMADARGYIRYGSDTAETAAINVADRHYFKRHGSDSGAGLIISRPLVSRVTGRWALVISRRVNNPDGSFAGVAYGVISLEHFARLFASIDVGKHGSITMRDDELGLVARYSKPEESGNSIGEKIVSDTFRQLIASGRENGTFNAVYPVDGIERTISFRKVSTYPLYVSVGLALNDYLAEWRGEVRRMALMAAIFFGIMLLASWLIYRDWLRRKEAVRELARQELKFRTMADFTYDWEFWLAPDGSFIHTSPSCERLTGHSAEAFYQDPDLLNRIVHPDDLPLWLEHRCHLDDNGKSESIIFRIRRADDAIRWIEHVCQPVIDPSGTWLGRRGSSRDITEREQANEERKKLEARLLQAQKMEAIGRLAGGIAHDFNNILTAIIGYTQILLIRTANDSQLQHYVEQVFTSAERAADLTKDLLAFSRKQVLHTEPLDACDILRRLRKMLERLIPEDMDFRTTLSEDELVVMADRGKIEQVIMNLVTNARDAMPTGGVLSVGISRAVMDGRFVHSHGFGEPGEYACISVADAGHGMDEETRRKLFEPFFTTKEVGKGTGLGMAIIYGVVKQHNGYISVYSEPGRGTTFRIYLPLIAGEVAAIPETQDKDPIASGTETILLAEDDASVRELHKTILETAGYEVIEAVDGQDALDRFMRQPKAVDMLVTDVIMPKIDGKRLYQEIEKIRPDMGVLFMSGYTRDIVIERGILDHEWNFLAKPVRSVDLLRKVRHILDQKDGQENGLRR